MVLRDHRAHLACSGHNIVGVFTIPDSKRGADPLAEAAAADGVAVHKVARWRALKKDGGQAVPEVLAMLMRVWTRMGMKMGMGMGMGMTTRTDEEQDDNEDEDEAQDRCWRRTRRWVLT